MKIFAALFSLATIGGSVMASPPAQADTAYHRVYRQAYAVSDPFSILDTYHNNALRPEEYKKGNIGYTFSALDHDKNGFLSRSEFYQTTTHPRSASDMARITPAAGGNAYSSSTPYTNIVYHDDPCDVTAHRNDQLCR